MIKRMIRTSDVSFEARSKDMKKQTKGTDRDMDLCLGGGL